MNTLVNTSFRRFALAGLIASSLVASAFGPARADNCFFGECERAQPTQQQTAASPELGVVSRHGTWTAMSDGKMVLIVNRFNDGSKFAIAEKGNETGFIWTYEGWHWREGQTFPVKIDVDGRVFEGTVKATSANILIATEIKADVIKALYNGRKVRMEVAGDTFTVSNLSDAAASIDDAVRYSKTSSM